uniref:DRBM domain-containing protein n=1 Tax=Glossina morsitans morsitans TaxID=37546 RepID=A0A1B0G2Q8_GLOMM
MVGKSSVSALQEYCAKNKISAPTYEWIDSESGSFICRATVMEVEADGNGRSKRDAKHLAASNIIKKLRLRHPDIDEIPQVEQTEIPTTDMIAVLRDYCVQHQHPLPTFEMVQEGGTPDAPEFIALCTLASIKRFGMSEKKKDARQKAALAMLVVIQDHNTEPLERDMQIMQLDDKIEEIEAERYHKFKTYREFTESTLGEIPGISLCDRHNYFKKFHKHLRIAAKNILADNYECDQHKLMQLFEALKINPKISKAPSVDTLELMVCIELNCEYDVYFANLESKIYKQVLNYFQTMLT